METLLPSLTIFSISFFLFTYTASCVTICPPSSCDETGPTIQFPFRIKDFQPDRCGYPGFDVSCNNNSQTILTLPNSGEFIVNQIDYSNQWIYIDDPNSCLPKRILNFSLSGSPFRPVYSRNYAFYNCSAADWPEFIVTRSVPLFCLGSANFTVIAVNSSDTGNRSVPTVCRNFSTVSSPVELTAVNPIPDMQLRWRMAVCLDCEVAGWSCGYTGESRTDVGCLDLATSGSRGLPRSAKYGIIIGAGIPGLVCLTGIVCYVCGKVQTHSLHSQRRRRFDDELSAMVSNLHPMVIVSGLDGSTIESYPKTVLGESWRLSKPNDGTCPICLAEYQPKETLRTIPKCNHYFHAKCVDEWLRMNATCPLCRNTPPESSSVTPSSSSVSSVIIPTSLVSSSSSVS